MWIPREGILVHKMHIRKVFKKQVLDLFGESRIPVAGEV